MPCLRTTGVDDFQEPFQPQHKESVSLHREFRVPISSLDIVIVGVQLEEWTLLLGLKRIE